MEELEQEEDKVKEFMDARKAEDMAEQKLVDEFRDFISGGVKEVAAPVFEADSVDFYDFEGT